MPHANHDDNFLCCRFHPWMSRTLVLLSGTFLLVFAFSTLIRQISFFLQIHNLGFSALFPSVHPPELTPPWYPFPPHSSSLPGPRIYSTSLPICTPKPHRHLIDNFEEDDLIFFKDLELILTVLTNRVGDVASIASSMVSSLATLTTSITYFVKPFPSFFLIAVSLTSRDLTKI